MMAADRQGEGPSPLTRGSLPRVHGRASVRGSIPAHAGQPCRRVVLPPLVGVHPRSRGAAPVARLWNRAAAGPSPLTRGSRVGVDRVLAVLGSIPAHAGQPHGKGVDGALAGVHPRSRGAAAHPPVRHGNQQGPSPLTRGSPSYHSSPADHSGSIPAHAGQPGPASPVGNTQGVHPRSRGAAIGNTAASPPIGGPSPLTRGSRA